MSCTIPCTHIWIETSLESRVISTASFQTTRTVVLSSCNSTIVTNMEMQIDAAGDIQQGDLGELISCTAQAIPNRKKRKSGERSREILFRTWIEPLKTSTIRDSETSSRSSNSSINQPASSIRSPASRSLRQPPVPAVTRTAPRFSPMWTTWRPVEDATRGPPSRSHVRIQWLGPIDNLDSHRGGGLVALKVQNAFLKHWAIGTLSLQADKAVFFVVEKETQEWNEQKMPKVLLGYSRKKQRG